MLTTLALVGVLVFGQTEVRVLRPDGRAAAAAKVTCQVGLARFALSADFERWSALQRLEAESDAGGAAHFAVEPGARLTVFARQGNLAGWVESVAEDGAGTPLALTLQPTGELDGKLSSRRSLRGYTLRASAARGGETRNLELGSDEEWTLSDLPSGEIELELRYGNWLALRKSATVVAGKKTKVPVLKVGEEFLLGPDPLVDAQKIRLIGADKKPVAGRKMAWSAPHMDGWMPSDEEGEIALVGGGVMIGPPPFVLRLGSLGIDQEERFLGKLVGVKSGTALVEVGPRLEPLLVKVTRGEKALARFQLFAVSGGEEPRVWYGKLEGDAFRVLVPPGELRLVVGTADGKLHEEKLVKPAGEFAYEVRLTGE
ncbi:MAG: hypothetical protein EXS08_12725 [Planctomycetes bacterium]|nr:hypothetical protein [Planctomycetota bacterium]